MRDPDEAGIRRYLLGQLPEGEAERLEEGYLARPEAFQRVRGVEDDLLDDYAAGRLTAADRAAFEARYLSAPVLRQRVEAARALRGRRDGESASRPASMWPWAAPALAAAVVLAFVVVGGLWTWGPRRAVNPTPPAPPRTASPLPGPTAVAEATTPPSRSTPATSAPRATRRMVLALSPTLLRSGAGPAVAPLAAGTDVLVLELLMDAGAATATQALTASIETVEGAPAWSGGARRHRGSAAATAEVPARRLEPGDYIVTLSAGDEVIHRYFFRVPRP